MLLEAHGTWGVDWRMEGAGGEGLVRKPLVLLEGDMKLRCGRGTGFGSEGSRDVVKKGTDLNSKTYHC